MEFLGIGPLEIALIALIAFIILGPDRIPSVMRQLGTWVRQLRELANNITRDYNTDIQQLTGEITALQDEIRSIQRDLGQVAGSFLTPPPPPKTAKSEPLPAIAKAANAPPLPSETASTEPASQPAPPPSTPNPDEPYSI